LPKVVKLVFFRKNIRAYNSELNASCVKILKDRAVTETI